MHTNLGQNWPITFEEDVENVKSLLQNPADILRPKTTQVNLNKRSWNDLDAHLDMISDDFSLFTPAFDIIDREHLSENQISISLIEKEIRQF